MRCLFFSLRPRSQDLLRYLSLFSLEKEARCLIGLAWMAWFFRKSADDLIFFYKLVGVFG